MKKLFYLAGLPRTGSTLLTSILYQNPKIHTEGSSALCETMWVAKNSLEQSVDLFASKRTAKNIIKGLPELYYSDVDRNIVIDKCFMWTLVGNIEMIKKYVNPNPKFIVMERPKEEIVRSFLKLMSKNNSNGVFYDVHVQAHTGTLEQKRRKAITDENGALAKQIACYKLTKEHPDQSMFHYVSYRDLVTKPKKTMDGIYDFLELPKFKHDFKNVKNPNPVDDKVYGLENMHTIRPLVKQV